MLFAFGQGEKVQAFQGNKPDTQTLIVSNKIIDQSGKMIDPESDLEVNEEEFIVKVEFSGLHQGDEISYIYGTVTPVADGTAEIMFPTGNCTPMYFDHVPVGTEVKVKMYANDDYAYSYETEGFVKNNKSKPKDKAEPITTETLQLQKDKDGVVIFSAKSDFITGSHVTTDHGKQLQETAVIMIAGIGVIAVLSVFLHKKSGKRSA